MAGIAIAGCRTAERRATPRGFRLCLDDLNAEEAVVPPPASGPAEFSLSSNAGAPGNESEAHGHTVPDNASQPQSEEEQEEAPKSQVVAIPDHCRKWSKNSSASTVSLPVDPRDPRQVVRAIVASQWFNVGMGLAILANCITIGIELTLRLEGMATTNIDIVEHMFLGLYIIELGLHFLAEGWSCLSNAWVRFDVLLVVMGIVSDWILQPLLGDVQQLGPLMVLRTARLLRLVRTVRLLVAFRELWMLVRGLLTSASTMLHTLMLMIIILYIFGCVCVEVITLNYQGQEDSLTEEFTQVIQDHFRTLPVAMLTLVQFVCLDNIVYVYKPLIEANPAFAVLFVGIILVVGVVLMNLVTAVIVNSAMEQAMQDKDVMRSMEKNRQKKLLKELRGVFMRLDEDGSGEVSRDEVLNMTDEDRAMLGRLMNMQNPLDMFDALDVDGNGNLAIEEFVNGVQQVALSNTPIEMKRMERQIESMHKALRDAWSVQEGLACSMGLVMERLQIPPPEPPSPASPGGSSRRGSPKSRCGGSHKNSDRNGNNSHGGAGWPLASRGAPGRPNSPAKPSFFVDSEPRCLPGPSKPPLLTDAAPPPPSGDDHPAFQDRCGPLPAWAEQLAGELRRICTGDVRRAVEEACRGVEEACRGVDEACLSVVAQAAAAAAAGLTPIEASKAGASPVCRTPRPAALGEKPLPASEPPADAANTAAAVLEEPPPEAAAAAAVAEAAQRRSPSRPGDPATGPPWRARRGSLTKRPVAPEAADAAATIRTGSCPKHGTPQCAASSARGRHGSTLVPKSSRPVLLRSLPEDVGSGATARSCDWPLG